MLKKANLLTHPTLARQDAHSPKQGRSERRGEAYASVRRASERCENAVWEKARLGATGVGQVKRIDFFSILLEFLHDPFGIAGQFHVALSVNWFSLCRAGRFDGAFPVGDLCTAFGRELLLCHAGHEFQ